MAESKKRNQSLKNRNDPKFFVFQADQKKGSQGEADADEQDISSEEEHTKSDEKSYLLPPTGSKRMK